MVSWTTEQVLALAPDGASVSAGRELASPAKWVTAGLQEHALWGEARGSGSKPYQTAVDLRDSATKCSCPSRKFPCKHALGLMLRYAQGEIAPAAAPSWVVEWLQKRDEKSMKQEAKAQVTEPDPAMAAKRAEKRWENILNGLDECEAFLLDTIGQGLLAAQSTRSWDQMAARMVDAQAPGLARRLRRIGAEIGVGPDWGASVAGQLGNLTLLMEAARRLETLPEAIRSDVRTALGIPVRKEALIGEKISDTWDVLGQIVEVEDRLTTCRSWLRGRSSRRWAMHLTFAVPGNQSDIRLVPGTAIIAECEFYPSAWPLRVHFEEHRSEPFDPNCGGTWAHALDEASKALSAQPWIEQQPVHLTGACLGREGDEWWVIDVEGLSARLRGPAPWALLAQTGNEPGELVGEWDGETVRLLGVWGPCRYVAL